MKKMKLASLALAAVMSLGLLGGCAASNVASSTASGDSAATEESSNGGETVKILCGYGVGGTADLVARKYAQVANQIQSKYNFIVENMTGGDGFAAVIYFADEDPSTKDLLVYGYGVMYRHDLGKTYGTEEVDFDRTAIYPLGTIDDRTWIVYTTPDQTLEGILEKAKNGGIKMSGGNPLSDCHLSFGSLVAMEGGTVQVVPYDGGANQKKGLTDGEVDVFVGTTQAAQDEVEAGTLVPILAEHLQRLHFLHPARRRRSGHPCGRRSGLCGRDDPADQGCLERSRVQRVDRFHPAEPLRDVRRREPDLRGRSLPEGAERLQEPERRSLIPTNTPAENGPPIAALA